MEGLNKIREFKKINWENIPDYGLYSEQLIKYIEDLLMSYFINSLSLSPSMINNYVKNGVIPKPIKKKYYREHIANLIVVVILKSVIPINSIKEGVKLQKNIMSEKDSFNEFMNTLERTLKNILESLEEKNNFQYEGFKADRESISLTLATNAFCFQMVTSEILNINGIYNKESEYE